MLPGGEELCALPLFPGAGGVSAEPVEFGLDHQEAGVLHAEGVYAAIDVLMAGDGLIEEAGFESEEFEAPLVEEGVLGEELAHDRVGDGGGGGFDDVLDALLPGGRDGEFAGVEVVLAGVGGDLVLAGRGDGAAREAGVGAVGGEFARGRFQKRHGWRISPAIVYGAGRGW